MSKYLVILASFEKKQIMEYMSETLQVWFNSVEGTVIGVFMYTPSADRAHALPNPWCSVHALTPGGALTPGSACAAPDPAGSAVRLRAFRAAHSLALARSVARWTLPKPASLNTSSLNLLHNRSDPRKGAAEEKGGGRAWAVHNAKKKVDRGHCGCVCALCT